MRDVRALAARVYRRWLAYSRRHPDKPIPVNDTLSRLFEHVPEYLPRRVRSARRQPRPAKIPGVFKLQKIAEALETTVGDLLGEPSYESPAEVLSPGQRRTLREAMEILRDLFDLDDATLGGSIADTEVAGVGREEFIERDHDYPLALDTAAVIRVIGNSMAPELQDGWKVLVDTTRTEPADGALVAVYIKDQGGTLGRWHVQHGRPFLRKSNTEYADVPLGAPEGWTLWGTVTTIVEAPIATR